MKQKIEYHFYFRLSQGTLKAQRDYGILHYYFLEIGKNNKFLEKSTGIRCSREEFDPLAQKFIGEDAKLKNLQLSRVRQLLEEQRLSFLTTGSTVMLAKGVIDASKKICLKPRYLLEVVDEYIDWQSEKIRHFGQFKHYGNIEESTYNTYLIRRNSLLIPFLTLYQMNEILLHEIDVKFFELFDVWITSNRTKQGKSRGQSYATKAIKFVKTVLNFAVSSGYITSNIGNLYKTRRETIKPVQTLTDEDIQKIENAEFLTDLEQEVLDSFLFCNETLLHHGDYLDLKDNHLQTDREGTQWIVKTRKKAIEENRQVQRVPLSEKALKLIQKYGDISSMPKPNSWVVSITLRAIAARAGLKKPIMFKMGRSSGISKAYNEKKMRGESISVLAGWTSPRELKSYLEVDLGSVKNEFFNNQTTKNNASFFTI